MEGVREGVMEGVMEGASGYVPPAYVPISQSETEGDVAATKNEQDLPDSLRIGYSSMQWSSGICACFDDTQSCCMGLLCPCILFGKNAEFLGSGTFVGSCMTHFMLWTLINSVCCLLTEGVVWGLPGCFIACYACGYRRELRSKYNLPEAPCGDFVTHFFCHLCAVCQEYREICDRSDIPRASDLKLAAVTAPQTQKMESVPSLNE